MNKKIIPFLKVAIITFISIFLTYFFQNTASRQDTIFQIFVNFIVPFVLITLLSLLIIFLVKNLKNKNDLGKKYVYLKMSYLAFGMLVLFAMSLFVANKTWLPNYQYSIVDAGEYMDDPEYWAMISGIPVTDTRKINKESKNISINTTNIIKSHEKVIEKIQEMGADVEDIQLDLNSSTLNLEIKNEKVAEFYEFILQNFPDRMVAENSSRDSYLKKLIKLEEHRNVQKAGLQYFIDFGEVNDNYDSILSTHRINLEKIESEIKLLTEYSEKTSIHFIIKKVSIFQIFIKYFPDMFSIFLWFISIFAYIKIMRWATRS